MKGERREEDLEFDNALTDIASFVSWWFWGVFAICGGVFDGVEKVAGFVGSRM